MSKYIDADALKMDLYSIIKADYGYTADVLAGLMIAERVIDNTQTADVAPVRHGQWIASRDEFCVCSICKYPVYAGWNQTNYCPNCGAKMRCDNEQK